MTITPDIFENALGALGTTPEAVAATLRDLGIKGSHSAHACPVSNYLSAQPVGVPVTVGSCSTYSYVTDGEVDFEVGHPQAVREFITRFDQDEYLDLEF